MIIRVDVLHVLQHKLSIIPLRTPHRIEILTEQMKEFVSGINKDNLTVNLDIDLPNEDVEFLPIFDHVICFSNHLVRYKSDYLQIEAPIFIPNTTSCCKRKFRIDPRYSKVRLYTEQGIVDGINYHGFCKGCKTRFYKHFTDNSDGYRKFESISDDKYFLKTSSIGFSIKYLERISLQVSIAATSFDKLCEMYNEEYDFLKSDDKINADLIENTWLIFRISRLFPVLHWHKKSHNSHVDVEKICQDIYPKLKELVDEQCLQHKCDEIGNAFIIFFPYLELEKVQNHITR